MSEQWVQRAAQSIHEPIVLLNSAGAPITGIAYNTSGLLVQYSTDNSYTWNTVTLVAGTVGVYTSGSWVERQNGLYQLDLPSTAYDWFGAREVLVQVSGVTGQVPSVITFTRQLVDVNPQDQFFGLEGLTVDAAQVGGVSPVIDNQGFLATVPGHPLAKAPISATATTVAVDGNYLDASPWLMLFYPGYGYEIVAATAFSFASGVITFTITRGQLGTTAIDFSAAPGMFVIPLPSAAGVNATLPATVPSGYATSANQTTILSQTTAASIAGAVWNALLASYNVASSFGNWLQSLINAPTASANATAAAAAILVTPSNKLTTDVNGNVTFNNAIPVPPTTTQIQAALAAGTPLPAVLSASQNFNNTGQTTNYPTSATSVTLAASQDFNNTGQTTPYPTSGGGGGSGSAALSFTVKSTAAGTPVIPNATISVIDASGAAVTSGVTNGSGVASGMACAPGSYTYAVYAGNFAGISGTLTPAPVAGNNPYVFSLTPNTLPIPSNPSECNVGIMIQEGAGQTGNVTITAIMTRVPPGSGNWFVGQTSTVVLVPGTQGYLTLYQNAQYSFSDGNTLIYQTIPPQTTWELPNTFS